MPPTRSATPVPRTRPSPASAPPPATPRPPPPPASAHLPLWLLACGIIASSLAWALNQERLGSRDYGTGAGAERFTGVLVQGFVFSIFAALFSLLVLWTQGRAARPAGLHFSDVFAPALCHTIASPIGQVALQFIPYPLFILISSCKLIPVMIVSTLVNRATGAGTTRTRARARRAASSSRRSRAPSSARPSSS
jgi:hypothetical protein